MYVSSTLIVRGDAVATAQKILASESLFRLGIVASLIGQVVGILYVLLLYRLLRPVSQNVAGLMVVFALVGVPMGMLNELTQFGALQLLKGGSYLTTFTPEQLQALAYLFLRLHNVGINIAFIFSGLWLLPLGYLVFRSGFLPKFLGVLLIIGGLGYLIDVFGSFLSSGYSLSIGLFTGLSEIVFLLWLLIKGVNVSQWKKRVLPSV
jgi:hypothetical protein